MNIIIVGCGKVGRTIAEQLNGENHDITVIDNRESVIQRMTDKLDIMGIWGDGSSREILLEAGVTTADLLIAVTDADELNLYICLLASCCGGKNKISTIARVRKPLYHKDLQESNKMRDSLGLTFAINPEQIAAAEMSRLIRFPSAIEVDTFAHEAAEIYTFKISRDSPLSGKKISDLAKRQGFDRLHSVECDKTFQEARKREC